MPLSIGLEPRGDFSVLKKKTYPCCVRVLKFFENDVSCHCVLFVSYPYLVFVFMFLALFSCFMKFFLMLVYQYGDLALSHSFYWDLLLAIEDCISSQAVLPIWIFLLR